MGEMVKTHVQGVLIHNHSEVDAYVDLCEYPHDCNLTINTMMRSLHKIANKGVMYFELILHTFRSNSYKDNNTILI